MNFVHWSSVPASRPHIQGPWLIYALLDPSDDCVRYVGMTSECLETRLAGHLAQPTNRKMREWLDVLKATGAKPTIRLLIAVDHGWQRAERAWIAWFLKRGDLLNVDPGGLCRDKSGRLIPAMSRVANIDWKPHKVRHRRRKRKGPVDPWAHIRKLHLPRPQNCQSDREDILDDPSRNQRQPASKQRAPMIPGVGDEIRFFLVPEKPWTIVQVYPEGWSVFDDDGIRAHVPLSCWLRREFYVSVSFLAVAT